MVADVDKASDVVEAVVDAEKLIRALPVVRTLIVRTLPAKIPPLMR